MSLSVSNVKPPTSCSTNILIRIFYKTSEQDLHVHVKDYLQHHRELKYNKSVTTCTTVPHRPKQDYFQYYNVKSRLDDISTIEIFVSFCVPRIFLCRRIALRRGRTDRRRNNRSSIRRSSRSRLTQYAAKT